MNIRKGYNTNSHKEVDYSSLESMFLNSPFSNMFRYSIIFFILIHLNFLYYLSFKILPVVIDINIGLI